jgi:UDP-N-acetylglucosamine 2-epimerase
MKIVSIVGARPEFIQATPVSRVLRQRHTEILVHTGQHYDYKMSQTFFDELGTPAPDYNLEVGSGNHGKQTADILIGIEQVLLKEQPDWVLIRGDTNSTLAGALAASKLHLPLAHIEAGERSFDKRMPEEINRLVADRVSDLHFCVSQTALRHLSDEGITGTAHHVGDVMLDAMLHNKAIAERNSSVLQHLNVKTGGYVLVTVHRAANTDDPARLRGIVQAINKADETVVFPVHPRTRKKIEALGLDFAPQVKAIEPVGYFDMIALEANARLIATDSGGVQREAYFLSKPCITLRDETEWTETVEVGWNTLAGAEPAHILQAWRNFSPPSQQPPIFGDGCAAEKIDRILEG